MGLQSYFWKRLACHNYTLTPISYTHANTHTHTHTLSVTPLYTDSSVLQRSSSAYDDKMWTRQLRDYHSTENNTISHTDAIEQLSEPQSSLKTKTTKPQRIFAITPTYVRDTQKVDLTSLCQTIMHVQNLLWIVVEDSDMRTSLVSDVLDRCKVESIQLNIYTPIKNSSRGVDQRNLGLGWIRSYCSEEANCTGSVYFMDDDNKYDLRLFEEVLIIIILHVVQWRIHAEGGSLGSIEPPFQTEVSGRLKQLVRKFLLCIFITIDLAVTYTLSLTFSSCKD